MCETDESERYLGDLDDQLFALHQLLAAMLDGIDLLDEHGVIRDVNGCLLELTGFVGDDLMGQDVSLLVPSRDRAIFYARMMFTASEIDAATASGDSSKESHERS